MADKVDATPKLSALFSALNTRWEASLQELRNNTLLRTYLNINKVQIMAIIWDRTQTVRLDKLDLLMMMATAHSLLIRSCIPERLKVVLWR